MSTRAAPHVPGVELGEVIGTGGSGVVYRGRQLAFDRPVAVKVVSAADSDSATRRQWEREVAAIGRVAMHPNVVPVFDAGVTDDGTSYLVMPLLPDGSLGDRLRRDGPLPPVEVAEVGVKLASALGAVHQAGVLHRDVKPDNVLCSAHGEPQLSDFGIARLQDRTATLHGDVRATISYAAPEVLAGEPATEATDVYGVGATLYACLTGSPPHPAQPGEHVAASVRRALEEDPAPLTAAGVPATLAAVVHQAIERDPAKRQPDVAHFGRDLQRALDEMRHGGAAPAGPSPTAVLAATAPMAELPDEPRAPTGRRIPAPVSEPAAPVRYPVADRRPVAPPPAGSRGLWLAVLAVLVVGAGLLLLVALQDDDGTDTTATPSSSTPAAGPGEETDTSEPAAAAPETTTTTEADAEAGEGDEDAETVVEGADADAGAAADAAVSYVETLDADRLDEAWQLTTPRFQNLQDREQWEAFWEGHDIEVVGEPQVSDGGRTVVVPLTYDGQREDYRLDLAFQGGRWLVDGPVGR